MLSADQCDHADFALAKLFGHFNRDDVATAGGNNECAILVGEVEITEDPLGQARNILEKHGLSLSVGAHHEVMKTEGEFDDRVETWKGAVTRPHFLHEDAAVAGAEKVDHPSGKNGFAEPGGGLLYLELLQGHSFEQFPAALEVFGRRTDHGPSVERSRPEEKRDYGWPTVAGGRFVPRYGNVRATPYGQLLRYRTNSQNGFTL